MPSKSQSRPDLGAGAPRRPNAEQHAAGGTSNVRAPVTQRELRELIDETAWLRARRRGRVHATPEDVSTAEAEVVARLGL